MTTHAFSPFSARAFVPAFASTFAIAAGLAAAVLPADARAQSNWPEKAITMVVPFPPGGVADTVTRPFAEALSRELKQPVVVENKTGAGGAVGMGFAARAPADGSTILMTLSSISILPEADRILGRKPAYALNQLKPIARFTADPTVFVVRADAPWHTLQEFVADAKKKPGTYNYGSSGNYGTMHVPMEILKQVANVRMTHIPYTGAGPAVVALLSGQVDAVATGPATVLQQVKAGKIRVLAHWGTTRLDTMPDVPSLKQAGYNAEYAQWSGLFVPAGTPEPVVQRLRAAARTAANDPKVKEAILSAGSTILYQDTPEFEKYVQSDVKRMADVVKKIGKVE
jgi:tripartite-type tricarboxylate transporter receptor subunit TctC